MNRGPLLRSFDKIDQAIIRWIARHGTGLLRTTLGIVFLWFGALKFFPGASPAEGLAIRTIYAMTGGVIPSHLAIMILASWECLIGLGLLTNRFMRVTLLLLFLQMLGTMSPLVFFPSETFMYFPYAPTLEGQYIIKNLVLVSAGIALGASVRRVDAA